MYSNDGRQSPTKRAKGKFPDIERALANWAINQQIKGNPLNDSKLQEQAQRFATTVGQSKLSGPAWLEKFKKEHNITVEPSALVKSEGQDESTPRMSDRPTATPVSGSAIEASLTAIDPRQMMKRNKGSLVSSGSPTQDDARRALELVWRYSRNQPAGFLQADEYAVVERLMVKLLSSISEGTAVLPGGISESLSPSVSKKRGFEAMNAGFVVDGGYSTWEVVSHVNVY